MPNTPSRNYPYPSLNDPANGPVAFQQLAQAVEADINRIEAGEGAAIPALAAYKANAQAIPATGVTTQVIFDTVRPGMQSGGAQLASGTITVPRTGWYQCSGGTTWSSSAAASRRMLFLGYGDAPGALTTYVTQSVVASAQDAASITAQQVSAAIKLNAGQVVGLAVNNGTAWGFDVTFAYSNNLSVAWLGPA